MKTRIFFLIILFLAASSNATVWAQSLNERFRQLDRDGDGKLSRQELQRFPFLQRADRDGDGFATLEEVRAQLASRSRSRRPPQETEPRSSQQQLFQLHQRISIRGGPLAVGVLDTDADGCVDLILPSGWKSGQFSVALNRPDSEQRRTFQVTTLRMSENPSDDAKRRVTKGLGLHDFDNDGRMDIVFVNGDPRGGGYFTVFRNAVDNSNHWLKLQVTWPENKFGLESKVTVFKSGTDELLGYDEVRTDFCYRSKRSPVLHFGLGSAQQVDITVATREGRRQRFEGLPADQIHTLKINVAADLSP